TRRFLRLPGQPPNLPRARLERNAESALHVADEQVAVPAAEPEGDRPRVPGVDLSPEVLGAGDLLGAVDVEGVGELEGELADDAVAPELDLIDAGAEGFDLGVERIVGVAGVALCFQIGDALLEEAEAVAEVGIAVEDADGGHGFGGAGGEGGGE